MASRKAAGYHPLVYALWVDLDALWRAVGPYADPRARMVESLARWVRLTGKGQVPAGEWWLGTLRALLAIVALVGDLPAVEQPRMARWLRAAKQAGSPKLGADMGPLDA